MSTATANKGRLELLLDEFTEVHGTVLLGMHKELQTIKEEVDGRVDTRIGKILEQVNAADSALQIHLVEAGEVIGKLDGREKRAATEISRARKEAVNEIAVRQQSWTRDAESIDLAFHNHQCSLDAVVATLKDDLSKQHHLMEESLTEASSTARTELSLLRDTCATDLQVFHGEIRRQRTEFQQDMSKWMDKIAQVHQEHLTKMTSSLKMADRLSNDTAAALKAVSEKAEQLHQREIALQTRTRQVVIGVGIAVLATLGFWIWLTLHR